MDWSIYLISLSFYPYTVSIWCTPRRQNPILFKGVFCGIFCWWNRAVLPTYKIVFLVFVNSNFFVSLIFGDWCSNEKRRNNNNNLWPLDFFDTAGAGAEKETSSKIKRFEKAIPALSVLNILATLKACLSEKINHIFLDRNACRQSQAAYMHMHGPQMFIS